MQSSSSLAIAAVSLSLLACGGGGEAAPKDIALSAPVTNYKSSGVVAAISLHWTRAAKVDRYVVKVSSPEGVEVWRTEAAGPPVMFNAEGVKGERLQWQVEGFEGTKLRARSKPGVLSLALQPGSPPP